MAGRSIRTFTVLPHLPERLQGLQKLAYNLWWCWNHDAVSLFRRIDDDSLREGGEQPRQAAGRHRPGAPRAARPGRRLPGPHGPRRGGFQQLHDRHHLVSGNLRQRGGRAGADASIAYFSARVRHPRERPGLFRRPRRAGRRPSQGGQRPGHPAGRRRPDVSRRLLPPVPQRRRLAAGTLSRKRFLQSAADPRDRQPDGTPLLVSVPLPGREVWCRIWRIQVGRVPLYLLDTNIPQNNADDRQITARLYGGDHDMRIRQEMVLGIGGIRALRALGKTPTVCHMNEGHSAFCGLERIRVMMEENKLDFATRPRSRGRRHLFHHAHAGAGRQRRLRAAADRALLLAATCRSSRSTGNEFLGLGRQNPRDQNEPFCMTVLAIRLANITNGVSKLHGKVSRQDVEGDLAGAARGRNPDHLHHQRRPHPQLAGPGDVAALRPLPRRAVGRTADRPQRLEARSTTSPTPSCGEPTNAAANGWWPSPAHRLQGPARSAAAPRRPRSPAPTRCSIPRP